jgi:RNA polymerase sigma-70 factor (ECF subfamily)
MTATFWQEGETSDSELVRRARYGDEAALTVLVERHYDFVYRVAYRWCGKRVDAEDIAQEVCVRLGRTILSFKGSGALKTWLYSLTVNAGRDLNRKNRREMAKAEAYAIHALTIGESDSTSDPAEALWGAVRQLPDKQREAVLLVYGEGLSHSAAAETMGCAEATVSWHIHEAKKRLKQSMRSAEEI